MSDSNKWDWVNMYFSATVLLGMSEKEFWDSTPRKLNALLSKYLGEAHSSSNSEAFEQLMQQ